MVKKYFLKAIALSFVLALVGFFLINQLDYANIKQVDEKIDEIVFEMETSDFLMFFSQTIEDKQKLCDIVTKQVDLSIEKINKLLPSLDYVEKAVFSEDVFKVREKYYLVNAKLFVFKKQQNIYCNTGNESILYFYPYGEYCAECKVQAKILDSVAGKCSNVRVFAFPTKFNSSLTRFFEEFYNIEYTQDSPALVINDKIVIQELVTEEELMQLIECNNS